MAKDRQPLRPLPHNPDAERSILGAILINNAAIEKASAQISTADFFLPQHRVIFQQMVEMFAANIPIDLVTIVDRLENNNRLTKAGGSAYIASLATGIPRVSSVDEYSSIVKGNSVRRQTIVLADQMQDRAWEGEETPSALISTMQQKLASIKSSGQQIVGGNGKLTYSVDEFLEEQFPPPEHLIEWIFSKSGSALIVAKPHHLKSWWAIAVGLLATVPGTLLAKLNTPQPMRTLLISVEDFPGQTQQRMNMLLQRDAFRNIDKTAFRIMPRPIGGIDIMDENWYQRIVKEIVDHNAHIVIFDVLRRIFRGDINSPKESSAFCEQMERIRDATGAATAIVHHENRKEGDIMAASAGSFNLPGWANSVIRFQRKMDDLIDGKVKISSVEIEVDNKFAPNPEPVRMVLDLTSETPVRLEELEDVTGLAELRDALGFHWTVNDLAQVLSVHPSNAKRRLKKLATGGFVEKAVEGKRGRSGGLARYQFVGAGS